MKIFVSWSGKHSLGVALALKEWLPIIFNDAELFVSSEDIRKGKRFRQEISKQLENCNFGIVCLTPENTKAEWILFESGALSKYVQDSSLWTLLLGGLRYSDIDGPLSDFQHTAFDKDDFYKLVKAINDARSQGKHEQANLKKIFDKFWDELETNVAKALKSETKPEKKKTTDQLLNQILEIVSQVARNLPEKKKLIDTYHKEFAFRIGRPLEHPKDTWRYLLGLLSQTMQPATFRLVSKALTGEVSGNRITLVFDKNDKEDVMRVDQVIGMQQLLKDALIEAGLPNQFEFEMQFSPSKGPPPRRSPPSS